MYFWRPFTFKKTFHSQAPWSLYHVKKRNHQNKKNRKRKSRRTTNVNKTNETRVQTLILSPFSDVVHEANRRRRRTSLMETDADIIKNTFEPFWNPNLNINIFSTLTLDIRRTSKTNLFLNIRKIYLTPWISEVLDRGGVLSSSAQFKITVNSFFSFTLFHYSKISSIWMFLNIITWGVQVF